MLYSSSIFASPISEHFVALGLKNKALKHQNMVLFFPRHIVTQHLGKHFSQIYINVNICVKLND